MRENLAFIICLVGLMLLTAKFTVCCTPARAAAALDVAGYTAALAVCRAEGKDAGSYAVYGACATEADRKYGLTEAGAP